MKRKLLFLVLVVIAACLIVAYFMVSREAENRIERSLNTWLEQADFQLDCTYSDLKVGCSLTSVSLSDVKLSDSGGEKRIVSETVTASVPISDLVLLISTENLENLHLSAIWLENLDLDIPQEEIFFTLGQLNLEFENPLSLRLDESSLQSIIESPPGIDLWIEDLEVKIPETAPEEYRSLSRIEEARMVGRYDTGTNELSLEQFDVETQLGSISLSGFFAFVEDRRAGLRPARAKMDLDAKLTPSGMSWGDPGKSGRITFETLDLDSSWDLTFGKSKLTRNTGSASLILEGFTAEFADRVKKHFRESELGQIIGGDGSGFLIDRLSLSWKLDDEELSIPDAQLTASFLNATLTMSAKVDRGEIDFIEDGSLSLSEWSPEIDEFIQDLEKKRGEEFQRDGDTIVIEISGDPDELFGIESLGVFSALDPTGRSDEKALPYMQPQNLVIWEPALERNSPSIKTLRSCLEEVAIYQADERMVKFEGKPGEVTGVASISSNLFDVIGINIIAGRSFMPKDSEPSRPKSAMISQSLADRMGKDYRNIGETVTLESETYRIIGILDESFWFPTRNTKVWIPLLSETQALESLRMIARLRFDVTFQEASARLGLTTLKTAAEWLN